MQTDVQKEEEERQRGSVEERGWVLPLLSRRFAFGSSGTGHLLIYPGPPAPGPADHLVSR